MLTKEYSFRDLSEFTDSDLCSFSLDLSVVESKNIVLVALIVIKIVVLLCNIVWSFLAKN